MAQNKGGNKGGKSTLRAAYKGIKRAAEATAYGLSYIPSSAPVKLARNVLAGILTNPNVPIPLPGGFLARRIESKDPTNLLSHTPYEQQRVLDKYSESYDLSRYEKFAGKAAASIKKSASNLLTATTVDILQFGELGKAIDEKSKSLPERDVTIARLQKIMSDAIPTTNLMVAGGDRDSFRALKQAIKENDPDFQHPQKIINAYGELRANAEKTIADEKKSAMEQIEKLFEADAVPGERSPFKQDLMYLLDIKDSVLPDAVPTADEFKITDDRLNREKAHMLTAVRQSYEKTEAELKEAFEGKPASKDKDNKDIPEVRGLTAKVEAEKARCEADLMIRAKHLEKMESHRYDYRELQAPGLSATIGHETDDVYRKRCLKGKTLTFLLDQKLPVRMYGEKKLTSETASGTALKCEPDSGGKAKISIDVPGRWFPYHLMGDFRLQSDFNDMVEKFMVENAVTMEDKPAISFEHNYEDEELRKEVVLSSYKAARAKGFKATDITMTVLGGDEKNTFKNKSALEVLQAMGLGGTDASIQADIAEMNDQKNQLKRIHAPGEIFTKDSLNALKRRKLNPVDDKDDEVDNTVSPTKLPGG
ncbi:MAG: hypothetical protein Q8R24_06270 [Legionellaceae bacterium]|nr:hypothetical protein [Legionellaceae bacterium]